MQAPSHKNALAKLRAVPKGFENSKYADELLEAVLRGLNRAKENLPELTSPVVNKPGIGALVDLLKVLLKQRSEETGVAPKLIANVGDLERIASDDEPDVPAMHGWHVRFVVAGNAFQVANIGNQFRRNTGFLAALFEQNLQKVNQRPNSRLVHHGRCQFGQIFLGAVEPAQHRFEKLVGIFGVFKPFGHGAQFGKRVFMARCLHSKLA